MRDDQNAARGCQVGPRYGPFCFKEPHGDVTCTEACFPKPSAGIDWYVDRKAVTHRNQ
jgi:hypothetical protein